MPSAIARATGSLTAPVTHQRFGHAEPVDFRVVVADRAAVEIRAPGTSVSRDDSRPPEHDPQPRSNASLAGDQ